MHIWSSGGHGSVRYCPWRENQTIQKITACAVAIKKNGEIVGHVPFNQAPVVSAFIFEKVIKQARDLLRSLEPK